MKSAEGVSIAIDRIENAIEEVFMGKKKGNAMIITKENVDAAFADLNKDEIAMIASTFPQQLGLACATLIRISYLSGPQWHSTSSLYDQYSFFIAET